MKLSALFPLFALCMFAAIATVGNNLKSSLAPSDAVVEVEVKAAEVETGEGLEPSPLYVANSGGRGIFANPRTFLPAGVSPTI